MSDRKPLPGKFVWFEHLEVAFDAPGVGRFGVMVDPTGAMLAIIKPTQTQP